MQPELWRMVKNIQAVLKEICIHSVVPNILTEFFVMLFLGQEEYMLQSLVCSLQVES